MEDAINTFSGRPVTALKAEHNCRTQKSDRTDVFHCPECLQLVFLCRKGLPFFRHQAHRGEDCTQRKWSNGRAAPLSQSTSEDSIKTLAERLLDALKDGLRRPTGVHLDPSIDKAVAMALMGREMLTLEGLDRNSASVLFHPYFAPLLRWILACIQNQTSISAMGPRNLAAFVQQHYFKPLLAATLGDTIQGEGPILGGLEPLQLSGSADMFEFEVVHGTGRPRMLYKGATIDCVRISSAPCTLLFRAHPQIRLAVHICHDATGHTEEFIAEICDQGWPLALERPKAAVISLCKINNWAELSPPLLYISSEWQPDTRRMTDLRPERRLTVIHRTATPLPAVRAAEPERWNGRAIARITGVLLLLAIVLSRC